jgi:hypothetical protein
VPTLPDVIARTAIGSPLIPGRVAQALENAGIEHLRQIEGWAIEDLLLEGIGVVSAQSAVHSLTLLASLPRDRLERISGSSPPALPMLSADVISLLCFATTVDDEIRALVSDLPERNRALVLARWGYGADAPRTLDEVGSAFGITRERVRQIVAAKEQQLKGSGLRLPLASEAVQDLEEAGGALPDSDYQLLLRYSQVHVTGAALRMLPALHELGCVPSIDFDSTTKLWLTRAGRSRLENAAGEVQTAALAARGRANRYLRRIGAVPTKVLDVLSPFGLEHAISLLEVKGTSFEMVSEYALRLPIRDSALLRQCRKTLAATGGMELEDLLHGLRSCSFPVSRTFLEAVLDRCHDFITDAGRVRLSDSLPRTGILSPAEARGFALLEQNGGAMSWWDFIDAMKAEGFSGPMAVVVLRKPAVKRLGPSTYGLRGRHFDESMMARLHTRRRKRAGRRIVRATRVEPTGDIHVTYVLNRFALQGVLPVPREIREFPGSWSCMFSDGRVAKVRISKGFMWPLQSFMSHDRLMPGDQLTALFDPAARQIRIDVGRRKGARRHEKSTSREEQILRALFGDDI